MTAPSAPTTAVHQPGTQTKIKDPVRSGFEHTDFQGVGAGALNVIAQTSPSVFDSMSGDAYGAPPTFATTKSLWTPIWLPAGTKVSNVSFCTAATAVNTPTHWLFGLSDLSGNILATSADQTSTAWGANTVKTLAMTTPYTVQQAGLFYIGLTISATGTGTFIGWGGGSSGLATSALAVAMTVSNTTDAMGATITNPMTGLTVANFVKGGLWAAVS